MKNDEYYWSFDLVQDEAPIPVGVGSATIVFGINKGSQDRVTGRVHDLALDRSLGLLYEQVNQHEPEQKTD